MRKSNVAKKLLACVLTLSTTLSIGLMAACGGSGDSTREEKENAAHNEFIEEIGGVSETYKGAVSENTYSSVDAAATAYVQEEVVGKENVSVINTTSQGDLSEDEIDALELDDETKDGMLGVEKVEVEYTTDETAAMSTAANNNVKIIVYIIKYHDSRCKYYSPCPVTGETITKSYFASVFDEEKYENCTMTQTLTQDWTRTQTLDGQTTTHTYKGVQTMTVKYDAGKMYLEGTVTISGSMMDAGLLYTYDVFAGKNVPMPAEQTFKAYYDSNTGKFICQMTRDGVPYPSSAVVKDGWTTNLVSIATNYRLDIVDVKEITPAYDQYLDYTYFTKTNFGFEVAGENAESYINTALKGIRENNLFPISFNESTDIDMFAKYYVSNGVLSGTRQDLIINASYGDGEMTLSTTVVSETSVKGYGTTVVTDPTAQAE